MIEGPPKTPILAKVLFFYVAIFRPNTAG